MSKRYERVLVEALDDTLETALGTTVKEVVYAYIIHEYNFKTQTDHGDLKEFVKALREVVGDGASAVIERLVVKRLCTRLGLKGVDENYSLLDLIERLKGLKEEGPTGLQKRGLMIRGEQDSNRD